MSMNSFEQGVRPSGLPDTIVLHGTGKDSDEILSLAIEGIFRNRGFNVVNAEQGPAYLLRSPGQRGDEADEEAAVHVTLADYQKDFVHFGSMPETPRQEHLSRWMAKAVLDSLHEQGIDLGISPLDVSSDDIRVELDEDELMRGQDEIRRISMENGGKPVVIVSPNASTLNRSLDPKMVQNMVEELQDEAVVLLLEPFDPMYGDVKTGRIGSSDIRHTAALLRSAYVVSVDSAALHMAAAVRQGTGPETAEKLGLRHDNSDILMITGSSSNTAVGYNRVRVIHGTGCPLSQMNRGCGMHGDYMTDEDSPIEEYTKRFKLTVYPSVREGDKSGCIFSEYSDGMLPPCMTDASSRLVPAVRQMIAAHEPPKA